MLSLHSVPFIWFIFIQPPQCQFFYLPFSPRDVDFAATCWFLMRNVWTTNDGTKTKNHTWTGFSTFSFIRM